ncbi:MAG: hypothetical protein COV99_10500 [Bacteroidetes bacterium CG12_big_fil_rev_8_21_14_0_65_60_17]|nr:MAG: hypothetical protein COV99_10500 [Bacteroidetes bacterium CG12_big_fil_rev_8_21_14_0_65_60_17]
MMRTILVPTDFSSSADSALAYAFQFAEVYGADVHILHIVERPMATVPDLPPEIVSLAQDKAMDAMAQLLRRHGKTEKDVTVTVKPERLTTSIPEMIGTFAEENRCDLLVMGTHGRRGARRLLLGSVTEEVIRHSRVPALAVREGEEPDAAKKDRHILVPIDLSDSTDAALRVATDVALKFNARIELLHVVDIGFYPYYGLLKDPVAELEQKALDVAGKQLEKRAKKLRDVGIDVEIHRRKGHVADRILAFTSENDVDLIVMASHGRSGIDRVLLGSVAERVLRAARVPVMVAPSDAKKEAPFNHVTPALRADIS